MKVRLNIFTQKAPVNRGFLNPLKKVFTQSFWSFGPSHLHLLNVF